MPSFKPGEVWQVDLGYTAKVRPCLLLSRYPADDELALVVVVPHTTAAEDEAEGKKRISPWWRVLKSDGKLNPKYPGGAEEQTRRLAAEGVAIDQKTRLITSQRKVDHR
jgi:mRNA-degrading endonuclease toxin of MazEF toxin-antitoxin module